MKHFLAIFLFAVPLFAQQQKITDTIVVTASELPETVESTPASVTVINKQSFENLPFVIPPAGVVAAYEHKASPLDEQIRILEQQSRTLATLRDTLLPKLLSGGLRPNL